MAEISTSSSHDKKGGKATPKKKSTRIDMTPMVDLGFLLLTFFVLTSTMQQPQTMELSVPSKEKDDNPPEIKKSLAITILPGKNDVVYYYFGMPEEGKDPELVKTNFSPDGLRKMLLDRNSNVYSKVMALKKKNELGQLADSIYKKEASKLRADMNAPMIIIKATNGSTYKNLVDVLDEMQICNVGRYALVDITAYDLKLLKDKGEELDEQENTLVDNL